MTDKTDPLAALSNALAEAVETASAYTVMVDARKRLPASGIVYAPDLVLTADHVVERDEEIQILLPNGETSAASVAGRDPGNDLALLRLSEGRLSAAVLAPQPARLGELVLALGRPSTVGMQASLGVVSAIGGPVRTGRGGLLEQYLRTDAIPYPGFSGGPLIDASGQVLGLNTSGVARGVALTIPAVLAWRTAAALAAHGHVRRGYLGIRSQPVELPPAQQEALGRQQPFGLLLVGVEADSPASSGGLIVGDILVGIGGHPISDPDELLTRLSGELVGKAAPVELLRGGQPLTIPVTIGEKGTPRS